MVNQSQFIEMFGLPSANHKAFKIGCIADIVSDIHYGTSRQSVENGDYPYLRMNNITYTGELDLSDLKRISIPEEELSGCIVKKGDVLFNRTNSKDLVGKTCSFPFEQPMVIAGYIIRLRMNGLLLPEYLSVFLNLSCSKKMLRDLSKGAVGQANINAKEVQSITILIPPIELQNQFVVIKNQADKSKFAGFKSQFIEMFGKTKQSSIGSLFDTTSGGTPSRTKSSYFDGGNIPWLTSSEVGQGLINKTESFITEEGLKNSSAKWVPANSVVVAMYGATVGKVGLLEIPCTTNQAVCSILPNESIIPMFLLYAVKDKEEWMIDQAAGAAQPNISQAVIRKMEIPVPPKEEQIAFVEIAKQADKSKYLN